MNTLLLAAGAILLLWIAYKIGKIVIRVVAGLAFLGVLAYLIWHFAHR